MGRLVIAFAIVACVGAHMARADMPSDPGAGAPDASAPKPAQWSSASQAFSVQLVAMDADHVRAFFENMGYPAGAVGAVARVCVFGTTIRNGAADAITYDVSTWRARTSDGTLHPLITKTEWLARWRPFGLRDDWSILPPQQTLQPGDWGQGFTTLELPPGKQFQLIYRWKDHGTTHEAYVDGVRCAR